MNNTNLAAPLPPSRDPEIAHRYLSRRRRLLMLLEFDGRELSGQLRTAMANWREALATLPQHQAVRFLRGPTAGLWWHRMASEVKRGSTASFVNWLQDFGRLIAAPALASGFGDPIMAWPDARGELMLPGLARVLRGLEPGPVWLTRERVLNEGAAVPCVGDAIELAAGDAMFDGLLTQLRDAPVDVDHPRRDCWPELQPSATLQERLQQAISIMHAAWPEFAEEFDDELRAIVLFRSERLVGWTDLRCPGAMFVRANNSFHAGAATWERDGADSSSRADPGLPELGFLLERLIHEASHLRLFHLGFAHQFHTELPSVTFVSPIRADPRPATGLLHAAFVDARVVSFSQRALARGLGPIEYLLARLELIRPRLRASLDTLTREVRLTPAGQLLIDGLQQLSEEQA